jgi:electron transfer flavoprotein alpha subunit
MTTLVLLDHDRGEIKQASRSAVAAALSLGEVHALVPGAAVAATAASRLAGVSKVLLAESDLLTHALAEPLAALIAAQAEGYSHICAAATTIGKNVIPRVAGLLGVQPISDVVAIVDQQTFIRPIYAGNALATLRSDDKIKLLTIRAASFDPVAASGGAAPIVAVASPAIDAGMARFVSAERSVSTRPELASARIVVSGGRGLRSAANFALLEKLADRLGAAIGASRAAVDAGFAANDQQVGQTGQIVAPDLYIAIGISGAIQHLAGMKDSKVIVAINNDPDAPIFEVADYGLVADLFAAVPELVAALGLA